MKKIKINEIIDELLVTADVKRNCGIYGDLMEAKRKDLAERFELWADTWLIGKLKILKRLINGPDKQDKKNFKRMTGEFVAGLNKAIKQT